MWRETNAVLPPGGGNVHNSRSNKQRVFVLAASLTAAAVAAQVANGLEGGLQRGQERAPFAGWRAESALHVVERLLDAARDVGKELVGALDLRRRERRRSRRVAPDRVQMAEE